MKIPLVTIVGRPNVGKSTLFNQLAGRRIAIVSEVAGTTRDRVFYKVEGRELDYFLVDTGGLEFGKTKTSLEEDVRLQAKVAIEEADLVLFVVDGREELLGEDYKVAEILRQASQKKPVIVVANKCDNPLGKEELASFYKLGLSDPIQVSAVHKLGLSELTKKIVTLLKSRHFLTKNSEAYREMMEAEEAYLNIAMVGRPNAGKSSLINALLNQPKLIVSDIPGTTRDSIDTLVKHKGKFYNFIDTAGLRRKGRVEKGIETYSVLRSLAAIERSDATILVLDSSLPVSHQDQEIARAILESFKGLILLANKWDLVKKETEKREKEPEEVFLERLRYKFAFAPWASVLFTSAMTKKNLSHLFEQLEIVKQERQKRVPTGALNHFVQEMVTRHKPTGTKAKLPKLFYITQVGVNPPHLVLFVNKKEYFHFSYLRYLENRLRERFGFTGTPIKFEYREKESRFNRKTSKKR